MLLNILFIILNLFINYFVCDNGTVQFTFFKVMTLNITIFTRCASFIIILVSCFSSMKLKINWRDTLETLHKIAHGLVKFVVTFIAFYIMWFCLQFWLRSKQNLGQKLQKIKTETIKLDSVFIMWWVMLEEKMATLLKLLETLPD